LKKLVIKTVLITVASLIGVMVITFGAMAIFAPRSVAGFFDGVGSYSASVFFYEKEYKKTDDIEDLVVIIGKACANDDNERAEKYVKELLERDDFSSYCAECDKDLKQGDMTTEEYYNVLYKVVKSKIDS
jgi:hypothetical protein